MYYYYYLIKYRVVLRFIILQLKVVVCSLGYIDQIIYYFFLSCTS